MNKSSVLIGIAGGTGSGKTSIANKLLEEYGHGEVVVLQQDSYYRDLSHLEQLETLISGTEIKAPIYDFVKHIRATLQQDIAPHSVIVLEGIFTLHYPELRRLMDIKIYVETPSESKFYADIIIPEGGQNRVAIDLIRTKINSILSRRN
jgi:uridine kinase